MKTFTLIAIALICALTFPSCGQSKKQPQTIGERVDGYLAENHDK